LSQRDTHQHTALPVARSGGDALVRLRKPFADGELIVCTDGSFLLDGGAMFGVVPKTLWQQRAPADQENRIVLGLNTVIFRTGHNVVLIETGLGNKLTPKMREIHQNKELLPASLAAAGIRVEEVTHVINTHLHFDHCGWNTTLDHDGAVRPTFPNARYFAAAGELAHARLQLDRDRVSYRSANYDPLIASKQLTLIDPTGQGGFTPDDPRLHGVSAQASPEDVARIRSLPPPHIQTSLEIVPGVSIEPFPGHTRNLLAVHLEHRAHRATEHACYISDLIPTHNHLDPTWVMGYDLDPLTCIAERKRFLSHAIPEQWLVLFTHDQAMPAARLSWSEKGRPIAHPE
jgi:glyoxylase-like metal-dependent hydrolase (beta-lactamase superfamily II)